MGSNEIGMLTHSEIRRGVDLKPSELDDWQKKADGWTITLCSDLSAEHFGPGVWPEFHFWKGRGHNGEPPTVADLIYSIANDCSFLESEPDQVTYEVGKRIEHNENKPLHRLRNWVPCANVLHRGYCVPKPPTDSGAGNCGMPFACDR